jgi:hypothetical protein
MRWVHQNYAQLYPDGTLKKLKPGVFQLKPTDERGFSMFLQKLMSLETCKDKARDKSISFIGIVMLIAHDFREFSLDVRQYTEYGEVAHYEVTGYCDLSEDYLNDLRREWVKRASPTWTQITH